MKKAIFILIAAFALGAVFGPAVASAADAPKWQKPVPAASSPNQTGRLAREPIYGAYSGDAVSRAVGADAFFLKFFDHPMTAGPNFANDSVDVTLPDGTVANVKIQDMIMMPGLFPSTVIRVTDVATMLDELIDEAYSGAKNPTHGFCPEHLKLIANDGTIHEIAYECDIQTLPPEIASNAWNQISHQIGIADPRMDAGGEFRALVGADPLLASVLVSSDENTPVYSPDTFPTTVTSNNQLSWTWGGAPISKPYLHVYPYGITEVDGGIVSASFDPLNVEKWVKVQEVAPTETTVLDPVSPPTPKYHALFQHHFSPLIFMRQAADRLLLNGYSAWQLDTEPYDISDHWDGCIGAGGCPRTTASFLKLIWKMYLGTNQNPIDVVTIKSGGKTFIAVVNMAEAGSLDGCMRNPAGPCHAFADGIHPLRDALKVGTAHADFDMPYSTFSLATFWEIKEPLTAVNPNSLVDPKRFAFIGPNAFDADVLTDGTKQYLVVASSQMAKTVAGESKYYISKIDPEPGDANKLFWKKPAGTAAPKEIPGGLVAQHFEVKPPVGYSPYAIKTADLNADGCGDIVLTWRGALTLAAKLPFNSRDGEVVYFRDKYLPSSSFVPPPHLFSNIFSVYIGKRTGSTCEFTSDKIDFRGEIGDPKREIPNVTISDFDRDNILDIIASNLIPEPVAGEAGKFAPHALAYYNPLEPVTGTIVDEHIRVGYGTTNKDAATELTYLEKIVKADAAANEYRAGSGVVAADKNGNFGSINGLPLMLPSFGCPRYSVPGDTSVVSPIPLYRSLRVHGLNPVLGINEERQVVPMWCTTVPDDAKCSDVVPPSLHSCCCGKICAPTCEPVVSICNEYRLLYPDLVTGSGYPDFMDDGECNHSSALHRPDKNLFAEGPRGDGGGSDGGGGTDFGVKCDRVYDSRAPFIASANQLIPAQANIASNANENLTKANLPMRITFLTSEEAEKLKAAFMGLGMDEETADIFVEAATFMDPATIEGQLATPIMYMLIYPPENLEETGKTDTGESSSLLEKAIDIIGNLGLIGEAYAGDPELHMPDYSLPGFFINKYRFPRGQVMPGKREVDLLLNATPIPPVTEITEGAADTKVITVKCMGDMDDTIKAHFKTFNEQMCSMVPGLTNAKGECNDSLCLAELGYMHVEINSPGGAAPSTPAADLNSLSLSADMTGNIGQAAFAQYSGMKSFDFTKREMLPLKVDNVTRTMVLLPAASTSGGRAITVSPDLMASASSVEPLLSDYMDASADPSLGTPNVGLIAGENKFTFNNVISWQTRAADVSETAKAAGIPGTAVNLFDIRLQPLLCSFTAVCEGSDAQLDENKYGNLTREGILKKAQENAAMCHDGVCPAEFYKAIGIPPYQSYGFLLAQGKVAKIGEAIGTPDISNVGLGGINVMAAQGGGCGCNVSALPPNILSVIAIILVASLTTTGFILVRVRARRK